MKNIYLATLLVLAMLCACQQQEQQLDEDIPTTEKTLGIQKPLKTTKKSLEEKARTVKQRIEYEMQLVRNPETGEIPEGVREAALKRAKQASLFTDIHAKNNNNIVITPRGPGNKGGRTRALAFDRNDPNIMLAGGVSSGVFRSTDAGATWTKVSSNDEIHNVTTIAQDPTAPNIWYYGTGELRGNSASENGAFYLGEGIWKSIDNGITWNPLLATQGANLEAFDSIFDLITRIAVHPTTGDLYAAAGNSIVRSTNGGNNWALMLGSANSGGLTEIIITPTGRLYAAFDGFDADEGVWTSATGNAGTWTKIAGAGAGTNPAAWNAPGDYNRIVLAYAPSNEDLVYALYDNNVSSDCGGTAAPEAELFLWNNGANSWTNLSANLPDEPGCLDGNDPFAVQGSYDLAVAVKPDDSNVVFVGGTNAYRSTDGFTSTANTTRIGGYNSPASYALYPDHHPDIHYFVFAPNNADNIYTGSDGGIHRGDITANAVSWTPLNMGYVTYQYYSADLSPTKGDDFIMGGTQDNGTTFSSGGTAHTDLLGGDGVSVGVISSTSTAINVLCGFQNGSIFRAQSGAGFFDIQPNGTTSSIFVTHFYLDQDNTDYLYYADGMDLYRTRVASTINATAITGNSNTGWELMTGVNQGSNIRALIASRNKAFDCETYDASDPERMLLIGLEDGRILRLNDPAFTPAATVPTNITPAGGAGSTAFGLSISSTDNNEALLAYTNYGVNSVYHTPDVGIAAPVWTNIEGSGAVELASNRSCVIASDDTQTLYFVGNSTGLYCTNMPNGGATAWTRVGPNDIGFAVGNAMHYRPEDQEIVLGTHGNGMFGLDLSAVLKNCVQLSPKAFLQGPLSGTTMSTDLATATLLPTTDPYSGTKTATVAVLANVVDWVEVEIRDASTGMTVINSMPGLLLPNGDIVDVDGTSPLKFDILAGNYHVAVQHRNHLAVMTANPILLE